MGPEPPLHAGEAGTVAQVPPADSPPLPRRMPRALDFAALAGRKAPPRPWVRAGWLGYEPTVLAGGIGKSGLQQHEATAGSLGRAYFAPECEPYTAAVCRNPPGRARRPVAPAGTHLRA